MSLKEYLYKSARNTFLGLSALAITAGVVGPVIQKNVYDEIPSLQTFSYNPDQTFSMFHQRNLYGTGAGLSIPPTDPISYRELVYQISTQHQHRDPFRKYKLDDILLGLMTIESRGQRDVVAPRTGASGIMQLMPATADECAIEPELVNHRFLQMDCAADLLIRNYRFLQHSVSQKFGDILSNSSVQRLTELFAITAYNNGMGNVRRAINTFEVSKELRNTIILNPFFNIEEIVPKIIGAGNVEALQKESLEYLPRFLQVYYDIIKAPPFSLRRWKFDREDPRFIQQYIAIRTKTF